MTDYDIPGVDGLKAGEVASCDDTASVAACCDLKAHLACVAKWRLAATSGTITDIIVNEYTAAQEGEPVEMTVDFNRPLLNPSPYRRGSFSSTLLGSGEAGLADNRSI